MWQTFSLGAWQFKSYGALMALAVLVAGMWSTHRLFRLDHPAGLILHGMTLTLLGGLAGGLLFFFIDRLVHTVRTGAPAENEGHHMTWVLVGGVTVALVYCRKHRISIGRALDLGGVPLALGMAIGRLGCFAAGCCAGKETSSWLGVGLPDNRGVWLVRYPTQLMCAAADLLILAVLLVVERFSRRRKGVPFNGFLFLMLVALYSLKRFFIAFLRIDVVPTHGPFGWLHLHAAIGFAIAATLILVGSRLNRARRKGDTALT